MLSVIQNKSLIGLTAVTDGVFDDLLVDVSHIYFDLQSFKDEHTGNMLKSVTKTLRTIKNSLRDSEYVSYHILSSLYRKGLNNPTYKRNTNV